MNLRLSTIALLALLLLLAYFVWSTSSALPELVASSFGARGAANAFMPRRIYVAILLALIIGVPSLFAFLPAAVAANGSNYLNIPNREYWLAPERREQTVAFLRAQGYWFAAVIALFLGYVHWLVVQANEHQPPVLSTTGIAAAVLVFSLLMAVWLATLLVRFRKNA